MKSWLMLVFLRTAVDFVVCGCKFAGLVLPVVVDAGFGLIFPCCCIRLSFVAVLLLHTLCCSSSFCLCCCCCWCHAVLSVTRVFRSRSRCGKNRFGDKMDGGVV